MLAVALVPRVLTAGMIVRIHLVFFHHRGEAMLHEFLISLWFGLHHKFTQPCDEDEFPTQSLIGKKSGGTHAKSFT